MRLLIAKNEKDIFAKYQLYWVIYSLNQINDAF